MPEPKTKTAYILGIVLFAEPLTAWRVACLLPIMGGVLGLKFAA